MKNTNDESRVELQKSLNTNMEVSILIVACICFFEHLIYYVKLSMAIINALKCSTIILLVYTILSLWLYFYKK